MPPRNLYCAENICMTILCLQINIVDTSTYNICLDFTGSRIKLSLSYSIHLIFYLFLFQFQPKQFDLLNLPTFVQNFNTSYESILCSEKLNDNIVTSTYHIISILHKLINKVTSMLIHLFILYGFFSNFDISSFFLFFSH